MLARSLLEQLAPLRRTSTPTTKCSRCQCQSSPYRKNSDDKELGITGEWESNLFLKEVEYSNDLHRD